MSVASLVKRMASSAIVAGALLVTSGAVAQAQGQFFGQGGHVYVKFLASNADDFSFLSYSTTGLGGTYNPVKSAATTIACATLGQQFRSGPGPIGVGCEADLGVVANGTEVIFQLFNATRGYSLFSGPGTNNTDGAIHAATGPVPSNLAFNGNGDGAAVTVAGAPGGLTYSGAGRRFGFEDTRPLSASDADYNDLVFELAGVATVTPEPSSVALMLGGLLALGVAARRRRRV